MHEGQATPLTLARHYLEIDRYQPALEALERAPAEELDASEYWLIRTEALRGLERPREAAESARRGLAIDPDDIVLLHALALSELDQDHLVDARRALEAALELDPDQPGLQAHLALTLARSGNFTGASRVIDKAMALAPDSVAVLRVRAQIAFIAEDPTTETYVADLLERAPDDQTAHVLKGMLSARQKKFVPSARALAEAARLDPSSKGVARAARESSILAHPLLAPVRPLWRIGRWRAWFIFLALSFALAGTGHPRLRVALLIVWLTLVVLSRAAPPILRWRLKRRFGEH